MTPREQALVGAITFYVVCIGGLVSGIVLLIMGINQNNSLKYISANVDFTEIENGCEITHIFWIRDEQLKGDGSVDRGCLDVYSYTFSADHRSDDFFSEDEYTLELSSMEHKIERSCKSCYDSSCNIADPIFAIGDNTKCWRPTLDSDSRQELSEWYRCGNEKCVKVFPPQDDEDRLRSKARGNMLAAYIILPCTTLFICLTLYAFGPCNKNFVRLVTKN